MTLRRFLTALALCAATLGLGWGLNQAMAREGLFDVRNSLVQFALRQVSVEGVFEITAGDLEDTEDGEMALGDVTIADDAGVWFAADAFVVRWNAARLLEGEIEIAELTIRAPRVLRSPNPPAVTINPDAEIASGPTRGLLDWPRAPLALRVDALRVEAGFIAAGVLADQSLAFAAEGALQDEGDTQALSLQVTRQDAVPGEIALSYRRGFAPDALTLSLGAAEGAGGLVAELLGLPEDSASEVDLRADGPLVDWSVSVRAEAQDVLTTVVEASIDATEQLAIDADARMTPGPALSEAGRAALGDGGTLELRVREDADGVIDVETAALRSPSLSLTADGVYVRDDGRFEADVSATGGPDLAGLVDGVAFEALSFSGTASGALSAFAADGALRLSGLETGGIDVAAGRLELDLSAEAGAYEFDVSGMLRGTRLGPLTPETLGPIDLTGAGRFAEQRLDIAALTLTSQPLTAMADGAVDLAAEDLRASYAVTVAELAALADDVGVEASGRMTLDGQVRGPLAATQLEGRAGLSDLRIDDVELGALLVGHALRFGEALEGSLEARTLGGPLQDAVLSAAFDLDDDALRLNQFNATALGATATGALEYDLAVGGATGQFDIDAPSIGSIGELLKQPLGGGVSASVTLDHDGPSQSVDATLTAANLTADGASIETLDAALDVRDAFRAPTLSLDADAANLAAGGASFATVTLDGTVTDLSDPAFTLDAAARDGAAGPVAIMLVETALRGPLSALSIAASATALADPIGPINGALEATADLATDTPIVQFSQIDLRFPEAPDDAQTVRLTRPTTLTLGDEITLSDVSLAGAGATLLADVRLPPSGLVAEATLQAEDVAPLAGLLDAPIDRGDVRLDVEIDTRPDQARGALTLRGDGLGFEAVETGLATDDPTDATLAMVATGAWDGQTAQLSAEISGPYEQPIALRAQSPLVADGASAAVPPGAEVTATLDWRGRVERLWALAPTADHLLAGDLDVALTFSGPIDALRPSGALTLRDGAYQNLEAGTILTGLVADTNVDAADAFTIALSAEDGASNPLRADVLLRDGQIDATASAIDAVLLRRDDVTAAVTADLRASGPAMAPQIVGDVVINRAEVRLLSTGAPNIADLGPVEIAGAPPSPEPDADAAGAGPELDLTIRAPGNVFVRGRGLSSEWRADLAVAGPIAAPRITGAVERVRGVLDLLGQPFELTRGAITFQGGEEIDPFLDVALERERADLTGRILVGGRASDPEISFSSTPALPEDEVLPRTIFGQSSQSLTATQALQLASGVATLTDGDEGLLGGIRSAAGLDVLTVQSGDEGSVVRGGRNVADGVFVGVNQPIDGAGSSVEVEVEVLDNITIDSEVQSQGGTSFGLNWKLDF